MQFLYVFTLMFLSIFGLTMLIKMAAWAFLCHGQRRHDVYVRSGDDLDRLVEHIRRSPGVARVVILSCGGECDREAQLLAEKYGNVFFIKTER